MKLAVSLILVPVVSCSVFYALSTLYIGLVPENSALADVQNIALPLCVHICHSKNCITIFYNNITRQCVLHSLRPYQLNLHREKGWTARHVQGEISSWATAILQKSSEYGPTNWSAEQILGEPDVYPRHGDEERAWAGLEKGGTDWIKVQFAEVMYIKKVKIYETYHPGGVTKIRGRTPRGKWKILWKHDKPEDLKNQSRILEVALKEPYLKTDRIKIYIDSSVSGDWVELDAVQVKGEYRAY